MNSKQRRKRDRFYAGHVGFPFPPPRRHAGWRTLIAAREAGIPWREFAAEVVGVKKRLATDIEAELTKRMPLKIPRDAARVQ